MGNILKKHKKCFTCEICVEPKLLPSKKLKKKNKCTHPFCKDCIIKFIQVKLDDKVAKIPCPALKCKKSLDPISCRPLIGTQLFAQWCDVLCESALLRMDRCYCPNRNCSVLIVNECRDKVTRSTCCYCRTIFCFKCKLPWHEGLSCDTSIDVAFARLAERNLWKKCPRCCYYVQRNGGCNIIYCRCGIRFCYNCGRAENQCTGCGTIDATVDATVICRETFGYILMVTIVLGSFCMLAALILYTCS